MEKKWFEACVVNWATCGKESQRHQLRRVGAWAMCTKDLRVRIEREVSDLNGCTAIYPLPESKYIFAPTDSVVIADEPLTPTELFDSVI